MLKKLLIPALVVMGAGSSYAYFANAPESGVGDTRTTRTAGLFSRAAAGGLDYDINKVTEILLTLGYTHIKFSDTTPPHYAVSACEGGNKVQLTVNQWAEITESRSAGKCEHAPIVAEAPDDFEIDDFFDDDKDFAGAAAHAPHAAKRAAKLRNRRRATRRGVDIRAPGTRVRVTKNRIRVRAPFVNIDIPR